MRSFRIHFRGGETTAHKVPGASQVARRRGANDVVIEMDRREFISLFGGAAAVPSILWPRAARAQQPVRMRRIGILLPAAADDVLFQTRVGAFQQALALLGWNIGRNI